jgi:hypothetical protein
MMTILKYRIPIGDRPVSITMPWGARILHVAGQANFYFSPFLWALVDTEEKPVQRLFTVIGDDSPCDGIANKAHELAPPAPSNYIGSAHCGPYVWHVFEVRP